MTIIKNMTLLALKQILAKDHCYSHQPVKNNYYYCILKNTNK